MKLHQQTCDKNPNRQQQQSSAPAAAYNANFELVQSAFNKTVAVYRRILGRQESIKDVLDTEVLQFLQREAEHRLYFKWYVTLKVVFEKLSDSNVITDPPACFRSSPRLGLIGTDYKCELERVYEILLEQIDTYEKNGSGWNLKHFVDLDVNICTVNNPLGRDDEDSE